MNKFLWLSDIQWSALSSISTFLAVMVALFAPAVTNFFKMKNILDVVSAEVERNREVFKTAYKIPPQAPQYPDYRVLKAIMLKEISIDTWNQYRIIIGENHPQKYIKFLQIYSLLSKLKEFSLEITSNSKNSIYAQTILVLMDEFNEKYGDV